MAAATGKICALALNDAEGGLRTSKVSTERMEAAGLLEHLTLDSTHPAIIADGGFLAPLIAGVDRYVVLYRKDFCDELIQMVTRAREGNARPCQFIDAFFLFLVRELDLPLLASTTREIANSLIYLDAGKSLISFDDAIRLHGSFFAWRVEGETCPADFIDLLTLGANGEYFLECSGDVHDYGFSRIANVSSNLAALDLRTLCRAIINPISLVVDKGVSRANVTFSQPSQLTKALRSASHNREELVFGHGGGICFRFVRDGGEYLALSLRNFHDFETRAVLGALTEIGVNEVAFDQAHFLSFSFTHGRYFDVAREYLSSPESLEDKLDVKEHFCASLEDIITVYEDIRVFELTQSASPSPFSILCHLATQFKTARAPFVPNEIIEVSRRLLQYPNAPHENIYLSLSASHWKHAFIEIYRAIEGLYYFGWMHDVRSALNIDIGEYELYLQLHRKMSWKYKEEPSIAKLFELIPRTALAPSDPLQIKSLADRFVGTPDSEVMKKFAYLIYSIRNSNVHQGKLGHTHSVDVSADCWPKLTFCLFLIVEHLYSVHGAGMP
ncbi:hypothetical protein [Stenotrophomonas geniculata]|uniref:hypothetical protein n=1 Tax=Stenotrophomonas geniculata TaxID=86188 RepID=UPI00234F747A|nr:hypothetical protein [Stenotrophomonas geniculata]MDC7798341.1 hypothetical protein [Stenotrophomonas geniculata]